MPPLHKTYIADVKSDRSSQHGRRAESEADWRADRQPGAAFASHAADGGPGTGDQWPEGTRRRQGEDATPPTGHERKQEVNTDRESVLFLIPYLCHVVVLHAAYYANYPCRCIAYSQTSCWLPWSERMRRGVPSWRISIRMWRSSWSLGMTRSHQIQTSWERSGRCAKSSSNIRPSLWRTSAPFWCQVGACLPLQPIHVKLPTGTGFCEPACCALHTDVQTSQPRTRTTLGMQQNCFWIVVTSLLFPTMFRSKVFLFHPVCPRWDRCR